MKKIILFLLGALIGFTIAAQPPMRPQGQRPLPNQFRDFVYLQQIFFSSFQSWPGGHSPR